MLNLSVFDDCVAGILFDIDLKWDSRKYHLNYIAVDFVSFDVAAAFARVVAAEIAALGFVDVVAEFASVDWLNDEFVVVAAVRDFELVAVEIVDFVNSFFLNYFD